MDGAHFMVNGYLLMVHDWVNEYVVFSTSWSTYRCKIFTWNSTITRI